MNTSQQATESDISELNESILWINNEIEDCNKRKAYLEKLKKTVESQLFYSCNHEFEYEYSGCYDDICNYRCKKCNCYNNEFMYKQYK